MRNRTTLLVALFVAAIAPLLSTSVSEGRGRHRGCCYRSNCCSTCRSDVVITSIDPETCAAHHGTCWCCDSSSGWVHTNNTNCTSCDCCVIGSTNPPSMHCGAFGCGESGCCDGGCYGRRLYKMICDPVLHRLRFPFWWEDTNEYYSLRCLGKCCTPQVHEAR